MKLGFRAVDPDPLTTNLPFPVNFPVIFARTETNFLEHLRRQWLCDPVLCIVIE